MRSTFRKFTTCILLLCFSVFAIAVFATQSPDQTQANANAKKSTGTAAKPNDKGKTNKNNTDKLSDERLSSRGLDSPDEDVKAGTPPKKDSKSAAKPNANDPK